MKVVIIEDDEFKQRRIAQAVNDLWPDVEMSIGRSVNSGLTCIRDFRPDAILLDMSLTTFDVGPGEPGGRPQNFGGIEVLRQMDRLHIIVPVIVITQHERFVAGSHEVHLSALHKELTEEHASVFKGLIYYNSAAGIWERHLRTLLRQVLKNAGGLGDRKNTRRRR
jgi:DNA-binding LytR/AlgR family response regulator